MAGSLGSLVVSLSAETAQFTSAMDKAAYQSEKRMKEMLKNAKETGAAIGVAMVAGVTGLAFAVKGAIDAADAMNDLSKATGVSVENLSGLQLAAMQSGSDLDSVAQAINKLGVNIGNNAEKFAKIGVTAKEPMEAFKQFSDIFRSIEDPQKRAAVAAEALGKSWQGTAPLLSEGSAKIQEMVDRGKQLSGMNQKLADNADQLNDMMAEFKVTISGVSLRMADSLLPVMNVFAKSLLDVSNNSEELAGTFPNLAGILKAFIVTGGNVAFVFNGIGREIGGIAAQVALLKQGDLKGALAVGDMMKEDAEKARSAFEKWQTSILEAGKSVETVAKSNDNNMGKALGINQINDFIGTKPAKVKEATKKIEDSLTWVAKSYAKAMESISSAESDADKSTRSLNGAQSALFELMTSEAWASMPEPWKETAIAQTASATALIEIADQQKRLNDMLAATPTAKLQESRQAMLELKDAFESGKISAEEFIEAAGTKLGTLPDITKEASSSIDMVITNSFSGMADTIADFVLTGKVSFKGLVESMIRDLIRLETQAQMTSVYKNLGGIAGIAKSVVGAFAGSGDVSATSSANFEYGSIDGMRASGGPVGANKTYLVGENGPELLRMGSSSGSVVPNSAIGGNSVTMQQVFNISDGGSSEKASGDSAGGFKQFADLMANVTKQVIVQEMRSGGMLEKVRTA